MKITVYTLTTDTDGGLGTSAYATAEARDAAAWELLALYFPKGTTVEELQSRFEDFSAAWDHVIEETGTVDSLNRDQHDVEVADPAPATRWLVLMERGGSPDLETYPDKASAEAAAWETIENTWTEDGGDGDFDNFDAFRDHYGHDLQNCWEALFDGTGDRLYIEPLHSSLAETERAYIGVRLEGGMVQDVFSNRPDVCPTVFVIDYDTDDVDEDRLSPIPQDDGDPVPAILQRFDRPNHDRDAAWFETLNAEFDKPVSGETEGEV